MGIPVKVADHERRDWAIIAVIILIGFICVFLAGYWAVRFAPSWNVNADLGSNLDPNSDFLTRRPGDLVQPVDSNILNQPDWISVILTPGALFPTRMPNAVATASPLKTPARAASATQTTISTPPPTHTLAYYLPTSTSISNPSYTEMPVSTSTTVPSPTGTSLPTHVPTITPPPLADLQVTINDGATHYTADVSIQYTIMVSNPVGPVGVTNAMVTGAFSSDQLTDISWTCTASAGASCAASGAGNITDGINLPVGSFVTYRVSATVIPSPSGSLAGMASVTAPSGIIDHDPSNNSSTDVDDLIITDIPPVEIGPNTDNNVFTLISGQYLTLPFEVMVSGHNGWDLVYYELAYESGIRLDSVVIEISDGLNWYTIFNWGNNFADINTNMDFNFLPDPGREPYPPPEEPDERYVPAASLYASPTGAWTGIAIDLDGTVPNKTYHYIRFYAPPGDTDGQMEIDALVILP